MTDQPTYVIETAPPPNKPAQDRFIQLHHHLIFPQGYSPRAKFQLDQLLARRQFQPKDAQ